MQSNVAIADATTEPVVTNQNIIRGPWPTSEGNAATDVVEVQPGVKAVKANHIVETLLCIAPMLFHNLELAGFENNGEESMLVIEAVKSLMMKHHGLYHPLQDVAANLFVTDDTGEVHFAERLELDLDPCDATEVVVYALDEDDLE